MIKSSIKTIDRILTGNITLGESVPESNVIKEVLHIFQSSRTGASPLDGLASYSGHILGAGGSYFSAETQHILQPQPIELVSISSKIMAIFCININLTNSNVNYKGLTSEVTRGYHMLFLDFNRNFDMMYKIVFDLINGEMNEVRYIGYS